MNTPNPSTNTQDASQMIRKDIKFKWDKFSDKELMSLKDNNELVTQVMAKYTLDKVQAQRDVDAVLKGRNIHFHA